MNLEGMFRDFEVGVSTGATANIWCVRPFITIVWPHVAISDLDDSLHPDPL